MSAESLNSEMLELVRGEEAFVTYKCNNINQDIVVDVFDCVNMKQACRDVYLDDEIEEELDYETTKKIEKELREREEQWNSTVLSSVPWETYRGWIAEISKYLKGKLGARFKSLGVEGYETIKKEGVAGTHKITLCIPHSIFARLDWRKRILFRKQIVDKIKKINNDEALTNYLYIYY